MTELINNRAKQKPFLSYFIAVKLLNIKSSLVSISKNRPLEAMFGLPGMDALRNLPVLGTVLAQPLSGNLSEGIFAGAVVQTIAD